MSNSMSANAKQVLSALYEHYKSRIKITDEAHALNMGGSDDIKAKLLPDWSEIKVADACRELEKIGFVSCMKGGTSIPQGIYYVILTNSAVEYMEEND